MTVYYMVNDCIILIHVDATNYVVQELVVEPVPEQPVAQEQQDPALGLANPSAEQQPEDKPRSITHNLKLCNVLN